MTLGAFSMSLNVKDIHVSKDFYEKLDFKVFGGDIKQNWLIMKNGHTIIGLFQGMFENNILTFNPGWDQDAKEVPNYTDVRLIQEDLKSKGIEFISQVEPSTKGPGSLMLLDPDGNTILVDQHV